MFDVLREVLVVSVSPNEFYKLLRLTTSGTRGRSQVLEKPFGFLGVDGQRPNKAIKSAELKVSFWIH